MPTLLRAAMLAALLPILAFTSLAGAAEVTFRVSNREVFVGGKAFMEISVRNAGSITPPVAPEVDGAEVRLVPGERTSQQTRIVNGVVSTTVTTTFVFEIVPNRAGRFTVPPFSITADGETFRSEPTVIVAGASETGDLLFVDVVAEPDSPMVGEEITLTLRIWVRPYRNPEMNVTLSERDMWQLVDLERSKLGIFQQAFIELQQRRQQPAGVELLRGDRAYYVYSIPWRIRPTRSGPAELGSIEISVNWPTGLRQTRSFIGERSLQISGVRPIRATPEKPDLIVRALPTEGQPEYFNGAVGRFRVEASAKPNEVAVGDPITLTFTIIAEDDPNALEGVQAPPFASMEELTRHFRIPSDPMAGVVQGRRKTFTQTFRPLDDRITEIPAIPFAFFDPRAGRYEVVHTEALPLEVRPADRLALSQIIGGRLDPGAGAAASEPLQIVAGGLVANAPVGAALLRDDRAPQSPFLFAIIFLGPPFIVGGIALYRAIERRAAADPGRRRAAKAGSLARAALAKAEGDPATILAALTGYVADRAGLAEGVRTRPEAVRALRSRNIDGNLVERFDRVLEACERARYAPSGAAAVAPAEARALITELERSSLRSAAAAEVNGSASFARTVS